MPTLKYRDPNTGEYIVVPGGSSGGGDTFAGSVPIGTVTSYAGSTAPNGWHLCDGTPHGSAELEAIIGSPNAPDLRDRFITGAGGAYAVGATGGENTHILTEAEMPSHLHRENMYSDIIAMQGAIIGGLSGQNDFGKEYPSDQNTDLTGGGGAHENRPPYYALTYIIKTTEVAAPGGITQDAADAAYVAKSGPQHWTPVLTAGGVASNLGAGGYAEGRYVVTGQVCTWQASFGAGTGGDPGTGQFAFNLPFPQATDALITWRIAGSGWRYGGTPTWELFSVDANAWDAVRLISNNGPLLAAGPNGSMGNAGHVLAANGSYLIDAQ